MMAAGPNDPTPWRPPPRDTDLEELRRRVEDLERHVNWILGQAANWRAARSGGCDDG